jgi:hypothetical protein
VAKALIMLNRNKLQFLQNEYIPLIQGIDPATPPRWGKMSLQQMVEHVTGFFKLSTGRLHMPLVTPAEQLPKFKEWLMSEKEFRENTRAPMLPDEPFPLIKPNLQAAIDWLKREVNDFCHHYDDDQEKKHLHPVFGELNFAEWVQLHHKHVKHHLKQFGVII